MADDINPIARINPTQPTTVAGVQMQPGQMQQIMTPAQQQAADLQKQIEQAEALRHGGQRKAYGAWGGLTQGLAEGMQNYQHEKQAQQLRDQQQKAYSDQTNQRVLAANLQSGGNQAVSNQPTPGQPPAPPPSGLGNGGSGQPSLGGAQPNYQLGPQSAQPGYPSGALPPPLRL